MHVRTFEISAKSTMLAQVPGQLSGDIYPKIRPNKRLFVSMNRRTIRALDHAPCRPVIYLLHARQ